MNPFGKIAALCIAGLALAACSETTDTAQPSSEPLRTGSSADESTCLSAVGRETANSVTILSSDFSQAGTIVMVGVGEQRAPWRCLISRGVVQEIMSMTDEGAL